MGAHAHARADSLPLNIHEALSLLNENHAIDRDLEKHLERDDCEPTSVVSAMLDRLIRAACPANFFTFIARLTYSIIPSFLQSWIFRDSGRKPAKLFPTSYLDGIRGLAAFFVFFCHYSYTCFVITKGYGQGEEGENTNWLQLPIIRLFYSGPPMVCVFFVVSGYALSLKPLKQMRARQWSGLQNTLFSSLFRRWIRLYGPTTISTFLVVVMLRLGWYEGTREFAGDKTFIRNVVEHHPNRLDTTSIELQNWGWSVFGFMQIWTWQQYAGSTPYDPHLWTIPVEFRASIVLFMVLLALSKVRTWIRFTLLFIITSFAYRWDRWEMVLFLAGSAIAELDLIRSSHSSSPNTPRSLFSKAWWIFTALFALYLMSQPDELFEETPGWVWLSKQIPGWVEYKYRYWQCAGSIVFVWAVGNATFLQNPFNHPAVQYLGRISYALYLVHGPVIHVVGYRVERWAWSITGYETEQQYITGFLLGSIFIIPATIWAADLFWRACDTPCVRFARWLEEACVVRDDQGEKGSGPLLGVTSGGSAVADYQRMS